MEEMKDTPQAPEPPKSGMSMEQIKSMAKGMPRRQRRELLRKVEKIFKKQEKARLTAMRTIANRVIENVD
jgi:hypothetical protein